MNNGIKTSEQRELEINAQALRQCGERVFRAYVALAKAVTKRIDGELTIPVRLEDVPWFYQGLALEMQREKDLYEEGATKLMCWLSNAILDEFEARAVEAVEQESRIIKP